MLSSGFVSRPRSLWDRIGVQSSAALVAGTLALVALVLGWRGADWPAQIYRAGLFRRVGFTQWDNQWYGGHHIPGYSVLFPPLASVVGVTTVAAVSTLVASWIFAGVAATRLPRAAARVAGVWFAVASATNVAIGRVTFALGLAFAIAAAALMLRRSWWALLLAVLSSLASPVAGGFVAIAAAAIVLGSSGRARRVAAGVAAAAVVPIAAINLTFPEGGRFPFRWGDFLMALGTSLVVGLAAWRGPRAVRIGALLYGGGAMLAFFVPNPLGGNVIRLATFVAGPILVGLLWRDHRRLLFLCAIPLVMWQWYPLRDIAGSGAHDPSAKQSYYEPLLDFLVAHPLERIEIPFTKQHWEAAFVAPHALLARGWERQLDIGNNPLFYKPGLTAEAYRQWLADNAISYVALPDVPLDYAGRDEGALLRSGIDGLEPVWRSDHWQVWRVADNRPIVEGAARLDGLSPNSFSVMVEQPGEVVVRIRYSSHWDIDGPACLTESHDGWTILRASEAGMIRVRQGSSSWLPFGGDDGDRCPKPA